MDPTLQQALIRDKASFATINKSNVTFICKCGTQHNKLKQAICHTSGAFCKDCTSRNTSIKRLKNKIAAMKTALEETPLN